jgi:hypothetical protein
MFQNYINYSFDDGHVLKWPTHYYYGGSSSKRKLHEEMWCEVQRKSGFTQQQLQLVNIPIKWGQVETT